METRAKITQITQAFPSRKTVLTIELDSSPAEAEKLVGKLLTLVLKPFRGHRSLDANNYYWQLVEKIAKARGISKTEQHNRLLAEYGAEQVKDGVIEWAVKDEAFDWTKSEDAHYRPSGITVPVYGKQCPVYWIIRGSHTYDTKEMSDLIDGTVYEAKEHGIETLTPDELERMKASWRAR